MTWKGEYTRSGWIAPTLAGAWINFSPGSGFEVAGYCLDGHTVKLRGVVASGSGTIFTLPAGFRPRAIEPFAVSGGGPAYARVDIAPTGTVTLVAGSNAYLSLSGIYFEAYQ